MYHSMAMGRFDAVIRRTYRAAAIVWPVILFSAPALLHSAAPGAGPLGVVVYLCGSVICHQRPERSFALLGIQMPVCARCTGIYIGAAAAALAASAGPKRSTRWPAWTIALASAMPSLATLVYEWTTGDMPSNLLRAAAGLPMGAIASWLVLAPSQVRYRVSGRVN